MSAAVAAQYATAAAGAAVALGWAWRVRRGDDPLGPRPLGALPDTSTAVVAAVPAWLVASFVLSAVAGSLGLSGPSLATVAGLLHALIGVALLPFVTRGAPAPTLRAGRLVAAGVLAGLAAYAAAGLLGEGVRAVWALSGAAPAEQDVVGIARRADGTEWAAMLATSLVLAPFGEEVFWRGALLPVFARRSPPGAAVVLQGLLFGAAHVLGAPPSQWLLAVPLAAVGMLAGWIYVRTASLPAAFLVHATFNGINLLFLRLA